MITRRGINITKVVGIKPDAIAKEAIMSVEIPTIVMNNISHSHMI